MRVINALLKRRWWIIRRYWFSELVLTIFFPVLLYLAIVMGLEQLFEFSPDGIAYANWVFPGLLFIFTTLMMLLPIFVDLFDERKFINFCESVVTAPNPDSLLVTAITLSYIPEVLVKCVIAGIVLSLLIGFTPSLLSLIGVLLFIIILLLLTSNITVTLALLLRRPVVNLSVTFVIFIFIIFVSSWIVPLEFLPSSLYTLFSYLPTTQLVEGSRLLLFYGQITFWTWLVPLGISLIWILLNTVLFSKLITR